MVSFRSTRRIGRAYCAATHQSVSTRLRHHKLPAPHLALWPTEVHVVVSRKVCEKGCLFFGIHTPLVATCKNKVCISNICHYLHFWQHTNFSNKDIQSPKCSVDLHLDHCIPVPGGRGRCLLFLSPLSQGDHITPLYTTGKGTPNIHFMEAHRKLSPKHVPVFPILTNLAEISSSFLKNIKTHGPIWQKCLSWPKFRPGPSKLEI